MTITRPGPPGQCRTRLPEASRPVHGTTARPDAGPPAQRRRRPRRARRAGAVITVAALAGLAAVAVAERAAVTASFAVLGHLHWLWIPAAVLLESASMAAFAFMLRRLLAAGGASVGIRPMLATSFAANALSVSIPLAGPGAGHGLHLPPLHPAGRRCPARRMVAAGRRGGLLGCGALVVVGGGLASGNVLADGLAVPGGVLAVAVLLALGAAARRPRLRDGLERPAAWTLRHGIPAAAPAAGEPGEIIRAWTQRLGSLQLRRAGWMTVTGLGVVNWLADAAVLVVSIRAAGGPVPWHDLLLVYGSGVAAQSLNITPAASGSPRER